MGTLSVTSVLTVSIGEKLPIIRPASLLTDWRWRIREKDNPTVVAQDSAAVIANGTRHVLLTLDDRYTPGTEYELLILDPTATIQAQGSFLVQRADFGAASNVDFSSFNSKLMLAYGLSGPNSRWEFTQYDSVTGIPLQGTLNVYTDSDMNTLLAQYKLKRRLNKVGQVVAERMVETYYDEDALFGTSTGTSTGS